MGYFWEPGPYTYWTLVNGQAHFLSCQEKFSVRRPKIVYTKSNTQHILDEHTTLYTNRVDECE